MVVVAIGVSRAQSRQVIAERDRGMDPRSEADLHLDRCTYMVCNIINIIIC